MKVRGTRQPDLAVRLLGRIELRRIDELLSPLATRKTQSLLAYLILHHNRPHSRDELIALFWGDKDEIHARHSLATALWRVNRLLGEGYLLADSAWVQFNADRLIWLDVAEFKKYLKNDICKPESLAKAVELYRGDFLEGFYDDWCIEERYRLESLYLDALSQLITWHAGEGNAEITLAYARQYLDRDPLDENIHLAAMRALVALGDLSGARRQWKICCETRQRELQAPPSPEMLQQAESILGAQFSLPLLVENVLVRAPPRGEGIERAPFVGREHEIDALWKRWEQAARRKGGMVLIGGEAGVGKTRMVEEVASLVRWHGGMAAFGCCFEPGHMLPYQPLVDVLRDLNIQAREITQTTPPWARDILSRLTPDLFTAPAHLSSTSGSLSPDEQAILFHAIATFIREFAERMPLLIVLEDLHHATDSTLAAVQYLARQMSGLRALIIGTFRLEGVSETHPLMRMALQLMREGLLYRLSLEPLSREAITELLRHTLKAGEDFVDRFYAHTEGNAFFSIETLRSLAGMPLPEGPLPLPDSVRALIESRLGQLSPSTREWVAYAAVGGRQFDLDLICHASGMDEESGLEAMEELLNLGILCEGEGPVRSDYQFVHHLVHDVAYTGIHHRRRKRIHRLIGEAMESLYSDQLSLVGALAHHFEAGGEVEKAIQYHGMAAQRSQAVLAWKEAEEHLSRMLQLLERKDPNCKKSEILHQRCNILTNRAELRSLQAQLAGRDSDLADLDVLAEISDDDYLRMQTFMQRARYLNLDAQYEQALTVAEQGLARADRLHDIPARCYLQTQIGFAHYFLGQPSSALAALESALANVLEEDLETRRHITHILGYVHFHMGNYNRALAYQKESYDGHEAMKDYNGLAWAGLDMVATYLEMECLAEAEQYLTENLDLARRIGARSAEAYGLNQAGTLELCRGNYVAAMEMFQRALSAQEGLRTEHGRMAAELGIGFAWSHLGDTARAYRWLEQAIERGRPIRHRRRLAEALIGLGLAQIASGDLHAAHDSLVEAVALARESETRGYLAAGLAALARSERCLGNLIMALTHASQAVDIAHEIAVPVFVRWGELEMGLVWLAQGDPEKALVHTGNAVNLISRKNERWFGSEQIYGAHARVLRTLDRVDEAGEQERLAEAIIAAKATRIPDPNQRGRYLKALGSIL